MLAIAVARSLYFEYLYLSTSSGDSCFGESGGGCGALGGAAVAGVGAATAGEGAVAAGEGAITAVDCAGGA